MFTIQHFLPQRLSSWLVRKLVNIDIPWIKNPLIKGFIKLFKVNLEESKIKNVDEFKNFNEFFTRELAENMRSFADTKVVSPSDGKIICAGKLDNNQFIYAKGHNFKLESLLADPILAIEFYNGHYASIYLSPKDYHRIHMPQTGKLLKMIHIPGKLYSVSLKTAQEIPNLFAQNERVVCLFEGEDGKKFILILVGAINVSSIETVWANKITPPYGQVIEYIDYKNEEIILKKGQEMGRFNMGSTVIYLSQDPILNLTSEITEDSIIKVGMPLMR